MNSIYVAIWFFVCIILQVLVFNHLALVGGVVLFYVYLLVKMPVEYSRPLQILLGFLLGLLIDLFSNTPGMHALTCTTIMWMRMPILHLYVVEEDFKAGMPNRRVLGQTVYIRFCVSIVICHVVLLYFVEAFTCFNFLLMLSKIVTSALLTSLAFIVCEEFQYRERHE